jgi:hypothetical protein
MYSRRIFKNKYDSYHACMNYYSRTWRPTYQMDWLPVCVLRFLKIHGQYVVQYSTWYFLASEGPSRHAAGPSSECHRNRRYVVRTIPVRHLLVCLSVCLSVSRPAILLTTHHHIILDFMLFLDIISLQLKSRAPWWTTSIDLWTQPPFPKGLPLCLTLLDCRNPSFGGSPLVILPASVLTSSPHLLSIIVVAPCIASWDHLSSNYFRGLLLFP